MRNEKGGVEDRVTGQRPGSGTVGGGCASPGQGGGAEERGAGRELGAGGGGGEGKPPARPRDPAAGEGS